MRDPAALQDVLDRAHVDPSVSALRPDYRVLLLAVDGLEPGPSDEHSEQLLQHAEAGAEQALADRAVEELPHVAAWHEAYRAFGAKPQRTRTSVEALLRRVGGAGLPRVNRRRTQLTEGTTPALFVLDALAPLTDAALQVAADDLVTHLRRLGPDVRVAQRLLSQP